MTTRFNFIWYRIFQQKEYARTLAKITGLSIEECDKYLDFNNGLFLQYIEKGYEIDHIMRSIIAFSKIKGHLPNSTNLLRMYIL